MVKEIVKDVMFLLQKAEKTTEKDKYIANDLLDTLKANRDRCVGLAANMIGYNKAIICISGGLYDFVMINPVITSRSGEYETEEGCLSLIGERKCKRYKEIEVDYLDINFNKQHGKYTEFVAEIIQHEIDHTNGIII
ncbi:MAG: peptide deformylase [Clostridia bacterium]